MTRFLGTARECSTGSLPHRLSDLADPAQEVLVDLEVGLDLGGRRLVPAAPRRRRPRPRPRPAGPSWRRSRRWRAGGISTNRMWRYGKKKIDLMSSTKTGRLPFIIRRFVQRRPTSPGEGGSYRSASSGCSLLRCRMTLRITSRSSPPGDALVSPTMVRSGVVEVDHQADPPARDPDADPDMARRRSSSCSGSGRRCTTSRSGS